MARLPVAPVQDPGDIFEVTVDGPNAPRVPNIYDYFTPEGRMVYPVMEYTDTRSTPAGSTPKLVAEVLRWLRDLPAPHGFPIGSVGGGPTRHRISEDYAAPLPFSSIDALERRMNAAVCPHLCTFPINNQPLTLN